jgi:hypothetical protein
LPEGIYNFSNKEEEGGAIVKNENGKLSVVIASPMTALIQGEVTKKTLEKEDGSKFDVLEIPFIAKSGKDITSYMKIQLNEETLKRISNASIGFRILPNEKIEDMIHDSRVSGES